MNRVTTLPVALLLISVYSGTANTYIVPPATLQEAPYAEWAHSHWVWLPNDLANQDEILMFVKEFMDLDIPVGAVDIDSGWSTGYNNFIFDTKKYPNPQEMVDSFHNMKVRVILWVTSMINTDSSNYKEAHSRGYLLRNGFGEQADISWWHGKGGLLDYTNSEAVAWWHDQLENVLTLGIDGWKCDGTDPYVYELVTARGKEGVVSRKYYSDLYYGDFFDYTREKLGKDRLIMSRPVDGFDFIFLDFSPRRVVLSGWVGDNDPTFEGMEAALKSYLQSAWAGYPNFGSDIGGYRSGNGSLGRTKELFIRWTQLGAFSPLMENGGKKEHGPWRYGNETVEIYRNFVDIHYRMSKYLLTTGSKALEDGKSSITPLAKHDNYIEKLIDDFKPSTYNYLLGDQVLVAPIHQSGQGVDIEFPSSVNGSSSGWVYWFNHSHVYKHNDRVLNFSVPLTEFTVFLASESIFPLMITKRTPLLGALPGLVNRIKWWLFLSEDAVNSHGHSFELREEGGHGMVATWRWSDSSCIQFNVSAHLTQHSLIEMETHAFTRVTSVEEVVSIETGYRKLPIYEYPTNDAVVKGGVVVIKPKDERKLLSALIFPGNPKQGISVTCCFAIN